jgi:hypothetical protein
MVGAPAAFSQNRVVYVYTKPASGWKNVTPVAELTAHCFGGNFGGSLAGSNSIRCKGAFLAVNFVRDTYIFVKPATG